MGILLRSCAEVRESIELSFGIVSVVGPGTGVLDWGRHGARGRGSGGFGEFSPINVIGALFSRNVLVSCVKS